MRHIPYSIVADTIFQEFDHVRSQRPVRHRFLPTLLHAGPDAIREPWALQFAPRRPIRTTPVVDVDDDGGVCRQVREGQVLGEQLERDHPEGPYVARPGRRGLRPRGREHDLGRLPARAAKAHRGCHGAEAVTVDLGYAKVTEDGLMLVVHQDVILWNGHEDYSKAELRMQTDPADILVGDRRIMLVEIRQRAGDLSQLYVEENELQY